MDVLKVHISPQTTSTKYLDVKKISSKAPNDVNLVFLTYKDIFVE